MSMPMPTLNVHLAPASRAHQLPEAAGHDRQLGVDKRPSPMALGV
jgi:hypothetical protein